MPKRMRAVVNTRYGSPDQLQLCELACPQPAENEVLVKVHTSTVSRTDCGMLRAQPYFMRLVSGFFRPKLNILGMDFAGTIESVGSNVGTFRVGDRVFGMSPEKFGAHAGYLCVPESGAIATMPPKLSYAQAVVCEGAWYADTYLKAFHIQPGQKILIYGASGAIGTAAVQLASAAGADVTAVVAGRHLALVKSLGANRVVDYTSEDFTQAGHDYDFVLDAVGKISYFQARGLLKPSGKFAATDLGAWWQNIYLQLWFRLIGSQRVIFPFPSASRALVHFLQQRLETGKFRAVIDRHYSLDQISEAYRYVESAQKTGIVVLDINNSDSQL